MKSSQCPITIFLNRLHRNNTPMQVISHLRLHTEETIEEYSQ